MTREAAGVHVYRCWILGGKSIYEIRVLHVQNRAKYKVNTIKIRSSPRGPATALTYGPNGLIFWHETPRVNDFGGTEAMFEFHRRDLGTCRGFGGVKIGA